MGRGRKSEKSARSEDQDDKEPEPYQPSGNFHADFAELCKEMEMSRPPSIVLRAKRPSSPAHPETQAPVGKKGKEDKKQQQQQQQAEVEEETPEEKAIMQQFGFKPKTFVVKNWLDLMRPRLQVEMENPDKQETVTEVFIRDWKLDFSMLHLLSRCFEKMHKLHSIHLWRISPDAALLRELAEAMKQLETVKTLTLESCGVVPEENFADLMQPTGNITKLQLRFNSITDKGAELIAQQLRGLQDPPSKLVTLDLSGNQIGDVGAAALAQSLRTNRTLLHLSLSNNKIGDAGAASLAQTCSRFFLTHDEVVERRKLLSTDRHSSSSPDRDSRPSRPSSSAVTPPPSRRVADRPGSVRSQDKNNDKKISKVTKGKKEVPAKNDDKGKGKTQKEDPKAKGKAAAAAESKATVKSGKGKGNRVKVATPQQEPEPEHHIDPEHPLLEKVDSSFAPGYLLIPGNFTLAFINLSRNAIGDAGIDEWKTALKYQIAWMSKHKVNGTGIYKLLLEGNQFSEEADSYKILEDALNSRDPLRPPITD